jgi:hypothetical protein
MPGLCLLRLPSVAGPPTAELAEDFLNYSQLNNGEAQRIGVKKKLTDKLKLGVEMDQVTPSLPGRFGGVLLP